MSPITNKNQLNYDKHFPKLSSTSNSTNHTSGLPSITKTIGKLPKLSNILSAINPKNSVPTNNNHNTESAETLTVRKMENTPKVVDLGQFEEAGDIEVPMDWSNVIFGLVCFCIVFFFENSKLISKILKKPPLY